MIGIIAMTVDCSLVKRRRCPLLRKEEGVVHALRREEGGIAFSGEDGNAVAKRMGGKATLPNLISPCDGGKVGGRD